MKSITLLNLRDILELVNYSLEQLYKCDKLLFLQKNEAKKGTCERSMVFRFGIYFNEQLEKMFPHLFPREADNKLRVDVEYNRNMDEVKSLSPTDVHGYFPDLIVHKRESNEFNEIIMEFKKAPCNPSDVQNDKNKIKDFCENETYKYKLGIFVLLGPTIDRVQIEYYVPKLSDLSEGEWKNYPILF